MCGVVDQDWVTTPEALVHQLRDPRLLVLACTGSTQLRVTLVLNRNDPPTI